MPQRVDGTGIPAIDVAVALILDGESRVLLEYDQDWRAFSLPMTKKRESETWEHAAGRAAAEAAGRLSLPKEICDVPEYATSDHDGTIKRYHFKCFLCSLEGEGTDPTRPVLWTQIGQLCDNEKQIEPVPLTTRHLARELRFSNVALFDR